MAAESSVARRTQNATTPTRGARQRGADARTAVRPHAQAAAPRQGAAAARSAALGTNARSSNGRTEKDRDRREKRWGLRELAADVSGAHWLTACGKKPVHAGVTVGLRGGHGEVAGFSGLETCGSWSTCPVCSPKVAAVRAQELSELIQWATKRGHTVGMMTLTARHHAGQSLEELWDGMLGAWQYVGTRWGSETKGEYARRVSENRAAWLAHRDHGGRRPVVWIKPRRVGLRDASGLLHYARAVEATHGESGWHVHFHVVCVFDGAVMPHGVEDQDEHLDTFRQGMWKFWKTGLEKQGMSAVEAVREVDEDGVITRRNVGIDIRRISGDAELARYLTKMNDAEAASVAAALKRDADGLAIEAAGGQFKKGRKASRSPFEVLADVEVLGLADDVELWNEWARVSRGRRQIVWSNGLRDAVGLNHEKTDEEIAAEEVGTVDRLVILKKTWNVYLRRNLELRLAVLNLAEKSGIESVGDVFAELGVPYWLCDEDGKPLPDANGLLPGDLAEVEDAA